MAIGKLNKIYNKNNYQKKNITKIALIQSVGIRRLMDIANGRLLMRQY